MKAEDKVKKFINFGRDTSQKNLHGNDLSFKIP